MLNINYLYNFYKFLTRQSVSFFFETCLRGIFTIFAIYSRFSQNKIGKIFHLKN